MRLQGVNANIMSLGGIAIAIGAMVDAAVVMIENAHKQLEAWKHEHGGAPTGDEHWRVITEAAVEVGPALFFSLLIITLSFVPVFTLEAQEGRMFAPLAFTKTYAMAAAAVLAVTLVPVLMGYFVRGRIPAEECESAEPVVDRRLSPIAAGDAGLAEGDSDRRGAGAGGNRVAACCSSAASSCRPSTRAISCTCRLRCPGCRRPRPASCCNRPTA